MQAIHAAPAQSSAAPASAAEHNRAVIAHLQRSAVFQEYQSAFETTTGLPLALRAAGSFSFPLHGSKRANPFCALMAASNRTCAACLQLQQQVEESARTEAKSMQCFAGLNEAAVPVRVGENVLGHLQTGQVLLRQPTESGFKALRRRMAADTPAEQAGRIRAAYFKTRIVSRAQFDSVVRLLSIFAQHLSSISNQMMVLESTGEPPVVAKARAFIHARYTGELSVTEVARAVNMSTFYFCKVFKQGTGLTFTNYLARLRVEAVKQHMLNPHARISEAAFAAGFQSLSQFNRVFRRIAGEAPTGYRGRLHGEHAACAHAA
ncbi:MAG: AraC family transcriptional regulator [Opitutus sp.]|nr:AraC family transcriptional regulator [Opitutus sp.]